MPLKLSAGKYSFVLVALLSAIPAFAADLVQVYREALAYDAQYAAARATAAAGREKQPQALAGLLPNIGASGNTFGNDTRYAVTSNDITGFSVKKNYQNRYNSNSYGVNLTQPLFRWQNFVQYDQSRLLVMQTEANFAQAGQDLILRVAQAYFDVLFAIENLRAVQANKTAIAQQLAQARKNFEVGTATITDTYESQSRFDLATAQEIAAENDLEVKRYALRVLVGKDPGELHRLKPQAMMEPPQPASMDPWVEAAERDNFVVQAQQAAAEAADKAVDINRAGHYPTVDVVANYGHNNGPGQLGAGSIDTVTGQVGLQINIPIFQGGAVNSRTREAIARRDAERAGLDSARRKLGARRAPGLPRRGSTVWPASARSTRRWFRASVPWSPIDSDTRSAYASTSMCSTPKTRCTSPGAIWRKPRFDTLLAQLKLKAAVGSLSESDLERVNTLFEAP
jgi:outer membrane protein